MGESPYIQQQQHMATSHPSPKQGPNISSRLITKTTMKKSTTLRPVTTKLRPKNLPTVGKVDGSTRKFFARPTTTTTMLSSTASLMTTTTSAATTTQRATTTTTMLTTTLPPPVPTSHLFLILGLLILIVLLVIGFGAILLVMKTRYDRYRLILTPMYRFDNEKDDLEAELLETPEKAPVSQGGKSRRNFGTCQLEDTGAKRPELNLME